MDVARERELTANAERFRRSHYAISGSPVRSHSPTRYTVPVPPPPHVAVEYGRHVPVFSHYE